MPTLVPVPVFGKPLQGKGKKQYGCNGKSASSFKGAVLGGGGGIHGHVITKKSYPDRPEGALPFPKGEGVAKRTMSDAELRHRKRLNAVGVTATSTLGLGALGAKLGSGTLRRLGKFPGAASHLQRAVEPILVTSGGIGGANGYNFAATQRAEAKKRGPVNKSYDPEAQRRNRNQRQVNGLKAASGLATAGAAGTALGIEGPKQMRRAYMKHGPTMSYRSERNGNVLLPDWRTRTGRALKRLPRAKWTPGKTKAVLGLAAAGEGLDAVARGVDHHTSQNAPSYHPRYRPAQH